MSSSLVSLSPDLSRLRDEGYDLEIRSAYLLVKHVPYVTEDRAVAYGTIVSELSHAGTRTIAPGDHTVSFIGGLPHDDKGVRLDRIMNSPNQILLAEGLTADCQFSLRPPPGEFENYYDKITIYVNQLTGYAQVIDPAATARTYPAYPVSEGESVFRYLDAASSRARITGITEKFAGLKIAIVGVGGTGSYVLDLVSKTPIAEVHLYDGDRFHAHNAFRAPGAAALSVLADEPMKAEHLQLVYDAMHRGIVAHPYYINESNLTELDEMDFVFLTLDSGPAKKLIVERLTAKGLSFIETGLGVFRSDDALGGIIRTVLSTPSNRSAHTRIPFTDDDDENYDGNIQVADLNMVNAVLAVNKWKKLYGFYNDRTGEHFSAYSIGSNKLFNQDMPA